MTPPQDETIESTAAMLGDDELEIQFIGSKLHIAEEAYDQDTSFERRQVSMSMRAAYGLLCWLYEHETQLRRLAQAEGEQDEMDRQHQHEENERLSHLPSVRPDDEQDH